jgi:hypothetical protein
VEIYITLFLLGSACHSEFWQRPLGDLLQWEEKSERWNRPMSAYAISECNMVQMPSCACSWSENAYTPDIDITRDNQQYRYDSNYLFRFSHLNINHIQIIFIKISWLLSHLYFLLACVNISIWSIWNVGIYCAHFEMWDNKMADSNMRKKYWFFCSLSYVRLVAFLQSEFSECDLVLPLSIFSIRYFP